MFWTVFKFELSYWFRRPLTLLFFALFFLLAFFATASDAFIGFASGQIHRNAPFVLATMIAVLTAIGQVITTAIAGTAAPVRPAASMARDITAGVTKGRAASWIRTMSGFALASASSPACTDAWRVAPPLVGG